LLLIPPELAVVQSYTWLLVQPPLTFYIIRRGSGGVLHSVVLPALPGGGVDPEPAPVARPAQAAHLILEGRLHPLHVRPAHQRCMSSGHAHKHAWAPRTHICACMGSSAQPHKRPGPCAGQCGHAGLGQQRRATWAVPLQT